MHSPGWLRISMALLLSPMQMALAQQFIGEFATIHISTRVVNSPCWLKMSSRDQTVDLPPVPTAQLRLPGMKSAATHFQIQLYGCIVEPGSQFNRVSGLSTWSVDSPVISATFYGAQDSNNSALFAVKGATGVGLEIADEHGQAQTPGIASAAKIITPINNILYWQASLVRTSATLNAGPLRAVVQFLVTYD